MSFGMDGNIGFTAEYANASGGNSRKDEVNMWYPISNSCAELAANIAKAEADAKNNDAYVANKKNSAASRRVRKDYADIIRGRIAEMKAKRVELGCDKQESAQEREDFLKSLKKNIPDTPTGSNKKRNIIIGVSALLVAAATIALIKYKA